MDMIRIISERKVATHEETLFFDAFETNLRRLDSLRDRDIDLSDIPEVTLEKFVRAVARVGLRLSRAHTKTKSHP